MYVFMSLLIISLFYNNVQIGISFIILAVLFSRTYFLKTFVPYCLNWLNKVGLKNGLKNDLKNEYTDKHRAFLGSFYKNYQDADSSIHKVVTTLSWISFFLLPILFLIQFSLYKRVKKRYE